MSIAKVIVEKFVDNEGNEKVRIKEFVNVLKEGKLPKEYLQNGDCFFLEFDDGGIERLFFGADKLESLYVEDEINVCKWEEIKTYMKRCGKRLTQINKELKERPIQKIFVSSWRGHVVWMLKTELKSMKQDDITTFPIIETEKVFSREGEESYRVTSWSNIVQSPLLPEIMGKAFERYQQGDCFYLVRENSCREGDYISIPEAQGHQRYMIMKGDIYPAALWEQGVEFMRRCVKKYEVIQEEESRPKEEIFEV